MGSIAWLKNKVISWATPECLRNYCLRGANIYPPSPVGSKLLWGLFLFSTHPQGAGPPTSGLMGPALPDPIGVLDGQLTHDETVPARHKALGSNRAVVGRFAVTPQPPQVFIPSHPTIKMQRCSVVTENEV